MKAKVCFMTGTRAEYGLLKPLMERLGAEPDFEVLVFVTCMHLSPEFGLTYRQIESDGIRITEKIETLLSSDTPVGVSKSMGLSLIGFSEAFSRHDPDLLILLGDRFETFCAAVAATVARIPIAHIHGGEITEGAIDDAFRHSITKMSHLHFTSTEDYRRRVIQLGENPERVFNVGAIGIDNIVDLKLMSRTELENDLGIRLKDRNALVTFNPVTIEKNGSFAQMTELLEALKRFPDLFIVFTKANADTDGRIINRLIDDFVADNPLRAACFHSLGQLRYLSMIKLCDMVIGNSSSGIIEAPSFHIPTVNIGDRQKGRIRGESVIDCMPDRDEIATAISKAGEPSFRSMLKEAINPYGSGGVAEKIVFILKRSSMEDLLKKVFYSESE